MSNSGTPIGENGRKELNVTKGKETDDLLEAYFADLREEGYYIDFHTMSYTVPKVSVKDKVGDDKERVGFSEIQDVDAKSTPVVKSPENYMRATKASERDEKNAEKFDKARAKAKAQSGKRLKSANEKLKAEREQANSKNPTNHGKNER